MMVLRLERHALQIGRHQSVLSRVIRGMGYVIPKASGKHNRKEIPANEISELYINGMVSKPLLKNLM